MHDWKPELLVFSIGVLEPMCVFFRPNWIWNSDAKWHWPCFLLEFLQGDGKYQKKNAELATAATIGWPEGWLWTKRNPQHLLCAAPCLRTCPHRLCLCHDTSAFLCHMETKLFVFLVEWYMYKYVIRYIYILYIYESISVMIKRTGTQPKDHFFLRTDDLLQIPSRYW